MLAPKSSSVQLNDWPDKSMNESSARQQRCDDESGLRRSIRRSALDLLARREHSEQELRRKLAKKFDQHDLIEQAVNLLIEEKLLNDLRFAESFTRHRSNAGFGPRRIALELNERGVNDRTATKGMHNADCDWYSLARQVYVKKYGHTFPEDAPQRAKIQRFMYYRGFSHEHFESSLEKLID